MNCDDIALSWRWKHFTPDEIACRCCGEIWPGVYASEQFLKSMDALEQLRVAWGKPIILNSGHRCVQHNAEVGGVRESQHVIIAFDCRCERGEQAAFIRLARQLGFRGVGCYPERGFVHLDMGRVRTWRG